MVGPTTKSGAQQQNRALLCLGALLVRSGVRGDWIARAEHLNKQLQKAQTSHQSYFSVAIFRAILCSYSVHWRTYRSRMATCALLQSVRCGNVWRPCALGGPAPAQAAP